MRAWHAVMHQPSSERKHARPAADGVLARLGRSTSGNVMMMTAVGVIPLLAMIGGAVDASRIYMSYARLQQACDSGALAGRKAMANVTALTATEQAKANEFFDFNFPTGTYAGQNITRTFAKGTDGVVVGNASVTMPTTIMKIFGFASVPLNVSCQATLNIPNTDVMFVLDVTGSMAQKPDGTNATNPADSKLAGLKQAVKDFYAALGPGAASGPGRVRYGFMPYSSNVNVGRIVYGLSPSYIAGGTGSETWTYQSRTANTHVDHYVTSYGAESAQNYGAESSNVSWGGYGNVGGSSYNGYQTNFSGISSSACAGKAVPPQEDNVGNYGSPANRTEGAVTYPQTEQTVSYQSTATGTARSFRYAYTSAGWYTPSSCQMQVRNGTLTKTKPSTTTRSVTWADRDQFDSWSYRQASFDVSAVVQNTGPVANPTYWSGYWTGSDPNRNYYFTYDIYGRYTGVTSTPTPQTMTWGGCIEEASTVNSIVAATSINPSPFPNDLKIDLKPATPEERWKPFLPQVQFERPVSGMADGQWLGRDPWWIANGFAACPREASALTQYASDYVASSKSSATFNAYVDGLTAIGGTYHDIGMIWGARFLSQDGIFSATNSDAAAPGRYQVSRNIVFMTDGTLDTRNNANDPWGVNNLDGRIAPTSADNTRMNESHQRRLEIICDQMQGKGFTVWVVGFGVSDLSDTLKACASGGATGGHWSVASDTATLRQTFARIAQTVGGLRLSS